MSFSDCILKLSIRTAEAKHRLKRKAMLSLLTAAAANPVTAQSANLSDMATSAASGASITQTAMLVIFAAIGLGLVAGGIIAASNKKTNPQIQTRHIVGSIVCGVLLISIAEIIRRSQSEVGLSEVTIG